MSSLEVMSREGIVRKAKKLEKGKSFTALIDSSKMPLGRLQQLALYLVSQLSCKVGSTAGCAGCNTHPEHATKPIPHIITIEKF